MTRKQKANIDLRWRQMRAFITQAYKACRSDAPQACLHDYAEDISWHDDLERLLREETANEKQHRGTRSIRGFSSVDAARIILMGNVLRGAELKEMPPATIFMQWRKSAAEANVIGYLVSAYLTSEWRTAVNEFDYSKMMEVGNVELSA